MVNFLVIVFLGLSTVFATVHYFAIKASLYWYYPWFDNVMHFWGGILLGLGVHAFCTFSRIHFKPTLTLVLITLAVVTTTWEAFEWYAGLWDANTYVFDTTKDMVVGFTGGLLAHFYLSKRTIRS